MCAVGGFALAGSSLESRFLRPTAPSCSASGCAFQQEVVHVALREDVAAARERGVLAADQRRCGARARAARILGAVDEAGEIARVQVGEAVHLLDQLGARAERRAQTHCQLEVQVVPLRGDVQQQVGRRRGRGVIARGDRAERTQPARPRSGRRRVPERAAEGDAARELRLRAEAGDVARERRCARGDARELRAIARELGHAQHEKERAGSGGGQDHGSRLRHALPVAAPRRGRPSAHTRRSSVEQFH
jgi:hypothetical protein